MTSRLGVYWSVAHRRPQDYAFFRGLNPSVMKLMDGGDVDYLWVRENLPDALVVARIHSMSEEHEQMLKDPVGTGRRHAQEWNQHQSRLGFDRAKTLILGINEPRIWEPGVPEALRQYTIAMCDEATRLGLRVGAMQLSVGWPNNDGPDTPPNWSQWHGVDNAIRANNGALVCHEYFADNGPGENWGWWCGRVLKCPWQVPIVIGEAGLDMGVKSASFEKQKRGWRANMTPERYARELADYVGRMSADSRYVGCAVFAADFADDDWFSFDIEPAYQAILATPIPDVKTDTKPIDTHLPSIGTGATHVAMYVSAPAGVIVRDGPGAHRDRVDALPFGTKVDVQHTETFDFGGSQRWAKIGERQWVAAWLLSNTPPVAEPAPQQPTGDNWQRSLRFVLGWEGGWADDPNDPGGATMKGITLGTYTRWRTMNGQPPPSKDDLRSISDEEVNNIYFDWYWLESGAHEMPWPLCLAHFNIAVNAGPARAEQFLSASGGNFLLYIATAMEWYTRIDGWKHFGAAWTRRNADLMKVASA